jgi:Sec-independent protein secretion pathway component TatC
MEGLWMIITLPIQVILFVLGILFKYWYVVAILWLISLFISD